MNYLAILLKLLTVALELWVARTRLQILEYPNKLQDEIEEMEDRMEKLRRSSSPDDHTHADKLRLRIYRKRGVLSSAISVSNSVAGERGSDSDKDGDIHPASG